jgi:metal-responsive CopG/Arc/MetJ family transcriptional regulator
VTHPRLRKVTLSLPPDLVSFADQVAESRGTNRSRVIADFIAEYQAQQRDALAAAGYRFYAAEAEQFAAAILSATVEALGDDRPLR